MATYRKWFAGLIWALLATVILTFWLSAFQFSYNFPYYDDFQNIVQFIYNYVRAENFGTQLALLFEQNFEHRVIFAKFLTLLQFRITGSINIQWLIFLGNLSILGILALFFPYFSRKQLSLIALFAITCLLFQMQHYEDTISWATCSLQHAPCVFFSLWSFHLALNRRNLFASAALALLALFTSANGLSTIVIWLIIVLLVSENRRKVVIPALLLVAVTIIHLVTLTIHSGSLLTHVTHSVGAKCILLLSFAGLVADPNILHSIWPSVLLGAVFLAPLPIVAFQMIRGRHRQVTTLQWLCVTGLVTLLFVAFLIVFARGTDADYDGYKMDRYKIYAAFFAALAVAFYDGYWSGFQWENVIRLPIAGAALLFCIASYYLYYGSIVNYRKTIIANQYSYQWSKAIYYPVIYADAKTPLYMDFALKTFFKPENAFSFSSINWKSVTDTVSVRRSDQGSYFDISNQEWDDTSGPNEALYAVAVDPVSSQPKYLFSAETSYQRAVKQFYTTFKRPVSPGFSCVIYKKELQKGSYDIYLLTIKKGQVSRAFKLASIVV
ncbi:hypothetical protein [Dyadobacter luticola]|uniref:YfhO family protein n=1 Tax=Dyadobacter luticola TaxID=1979387 RepID=A0A5R9L3X3_9BACT|nr:hypothetical protein [Dyadobacter luticola]TLV03266.1 hypothetical protein FEN17_06550 [Dyadobacter luticola]